MIDTIAPTKDRRVRKQELYGIERTLMETGIGGEEVVFIISDEALDKRRRKELKIKRIRTVEDLSRLDSDFPLIAIKGRKEFYIGLGRYGNDTLASHDKYTLSKNNGSIFLNKYCTVQQASEEEILKPVIQQNITDLKYPDQLKAVIDLL